MRGLPSGLYQPGHSLLHRLCPWSKLLCLLLLLCAVVTTKTLWGYLILVVLAAVLCACSRLPVGAVLGAVWRLKWFFVTILVMNLCFYSPQQPWFKWWILTPSQEGLMQGLHTVVRVVLLLIFSGLVTATTAPLAMTGAMEILLWPLSLVRIPVGQIAMILSVAVQFVPTLLEEADAIRKAQTARGAGFDSRRLRDRAGALAPLVVPVFLAAFKRADELSLAMEARGYRPNCSNKLPRQRTGWKDGAALLICTLAAAAGIFLM